MGVVSIPWAFAPLAENHDVTEGAYPQLKKRK